MVTHHGTNVHKVISLTFAFDQGVDPYLGTAVRLESHKQHPMTEPLITEATDPFRFNASSLALPIQ